MLNKIASNYLKHLSTINNKISNFVLPNFPSDVINTTSTAEKVQTNTQTYSSVPLVDPSLVYVGTYQDPAETGATTTQPPADAHSYIYI